jgi:hypothetical protein
LADGKREYGDVMARCRAFDAELVAQAEATGGAQYAKDVTYPSAPPFLLYNPDLVKGILTPIFEFCRTDMWPFAFAAHDVGRYPKAKWYPSSML